MYNPAIVGAIIAQAVISKVSSLAGAISGYIITTGILIWGTSTYSDGNCITIFNAPLSQNGFYLACLVWYGIDTYGLLKVVKPILKAKKNSVFFEKYIENNDTVIGFYNTTFAEWGNGKLNDISPSYQKEASSVPMDTFIKNYSISEGSALHTFFEKYKPLEGEFLVVVGNNETTTGTQGWCVLTNKRLLQRDGLTNEFKEVNLANVDTYQISGKELKTINFKTSGGEEIVFDKVQVYPAETHLGKVISMVKAAV